MEVTVRCWPAMRVSSMVTRSTKSAFAWDHGAQLALAAQRQGGAFAGALAGAPGDFAEDERGGQPDQRISDDALQPSGVILVEALLRQVEGEQGGGGDDGRRGGLGGAVLGGYEEDRRGRTGAVRGR